MDASSPETLVKLRCARCGRQLGRWTVGYVPSDDPAGGGGPAAIPARDLVEKGTVGPGPGRAIERPPGRFGPFELFPWADGPFRAASSGMGLVIDCSCRVGWRRRRISVTFEGLYKLVRRAGLRPEVELSL
jgi:hypothetical protein